ncbi:Zn(II)2Cys6 transcription factor [Aspergillus ibericus CBS 121593]|uniref:Zn(II)2Cys6 transcription factor n=1 Tax=Aspergillus ibericus CBS 121593 TaxID=1448316 RepID=A0A395H0H8_9EURO|nr:Zn(II)2Cys6 transcription factor [Aspergillus ibericus CBS 121593]RAL01120.1 Zn(II)2Cys6 transcription factor [Aspergillus ibericus CBS 121593]
MDMPDEPASKRRCHKERVRVTRACDACKKKKLRCTGTLPCASCLRTGKPCEYTAEYNRGKLPQVRIAQPAPGTEQQQKQASAVEGDRSPSLQYSLVGENCTMPENHAVENPPSRASPEPHQTDLEGHYVGPSSGVSFLLRAQRKLHKYVALPINTPIFTFGDSPLPEAESTFMLLPPRNEANALLTRYFDFAFPTHRFLHQPQVESWVEEFYGAVQRSEGVTPGTRGKRAVVLMVFAQAKQSQLDSDQSSARSLVSSAAYFAASEQQLSAETGPVRITSVQARLAQCFYLLSQSRINHCWSLFGTTARLAMTLGMHRARRRENGAVDHIESELRKRVFWCAYSLDNYLSAALGRPRIFHDDDIDQDFPTVADDSRILRDQILASESTTQSIMLAPLYHAKLSVIIGRILHDMYGIHRGSSQAEVAAAAQHGAHLTRWRQELSGFLDSSNVDLLMLTYQRQYTVLNLAFYHAQILLYRPFILRHFGTNNRERSRNDSSSRAVDQYIKVCLVAAMKIAAIIRELCEKRRMYSTFWFTHYYAFSAIMILYLRVIQLAAQKGDGGEVSKYLHTGERAQRDLAGCCSQSSFVQRYVVVLEELRQEARIAANQTDHPPDATRDQTFSYGGNQGIGQLGPQAFRPDEIEVNRMEVAERLQGSNLMPAVMESDIPGWTEGGAEDNFPVPASSGLADWEGLDSLAIAGLGELDYLFSHGGS